MKTCIFTVVKDEHEYLDEWIRYNTGLGIDHMFIFEDVWSKPHNQICDKYPNVTLKKIEDLFEDRNRPYNMKNKRWFPQTEYIQLGIMWIKNNSDYDWCFSIDNDEFITTDEPLDKLLPEYSEYDAIMLQWKNFGANGLVSKPVYDKPTWEIFTKECDFLSDDISRHTTTKICYNMPKLESGFLCGTHTAACNYVKPDFTHDRTTYVYDRIYIRHYMTRSWEEYVWKIKIRGDIAFNYRKLEHFFEMNKDMMPLKETLMQQVKGNKYKRSGVIFDIGCYTGDTTAQFLASGNSVVAVDANPENIAAVKEHFKKEIEEKRLSVVETAIGNGLNVTLYISDFPIWTSTHEEIAARNGTGTREITVDCHNIEDLFAQYSMPYYCKIDIEQDDIVALNQIKGRYKPEFISCETECIGDRPLHDGEDIAVITALKDIGYKKFCLVMQCNKRIMGTEKRLETCFPEFIDDDCWMTYEKACEIVQDFDRSQLFNKWDFWVDVYATE